MARGKQYSSPLDPGTSAGTNGILFARLRIAARRFCGCRQAQRAFAVGKHGVDKLPTPHSSSIPKIERIAAKRKSNPA
jgi:hypothetical protein